MQTEQEAFLDVILLIGRDKLKKKYPYPGRPRRKPGETKGESTAQKAALPDDAADVGAHPAETGNDENETPRLRPYSRKLRRSRRDLSGRTGRAYASVL